MSSVAQAPLPSSLVVVSKGARLKRVTYTHLCLFTVPGLSG